MNTSLDALGQLADSSLTHDQLLKYAKDLARLYRKEKLHREELGAINRRLMAEIQSKEALEAALRAGEAKYRSLFEQSYDPIFVTSAEGILIDANKAYWEMFGCDAGDLIGRSFLETIADPFDASRLKKAIDESESIKNLEIKARTNDGTIIDCLLSLVARSAPDGAIEGYQGTIRDLTEHKMLQKRNELARRMEALAHLAGGIAHEIRNPLAVSSSAAQLLLHDKLDPRLRKECTEKIFVGMHKASLVIENLVAFARSIEDYPISRFNLVKVLEASVQIILSQALPVPVKAKKNFKFRELFMIGSEELIHRAFLNLLQNSVEAMPHGGELSVDLDSQQGRAIVVVRDTGTGIIAEEREKIFDPFYAGQNSMRLGLGLTLASRIVLEHRGSIDVQSSVGVGSTFTVCLPLNAFVKGQPNGFA